MAFGCSASGREIHEPVYFLIFGGQVIQISSERFVIGVFVITEIIPLNVSSQYLMF